MRLVVGLLVAFGVAMGPWGQGAWHDPGPPVAPAGPLIRHFETMCLQTQGDVQQAIEAGERAGWYPMMEDGEGLSIYSPVVQHPRAPGRVYFPAHMTVWDYPDEVRCEVGTTGGTDDWALLIREVEGHFGLDLQPVDEDTPSGDCEAAAWETGEIQVCYFQGVEGGGFDIAFVVPRG